MTRRSKRRYIARTPVSAPEEPALPAGPTPPYLTRRRYHRLLATLARRQPDLTVVLENIYDAFNVSAVLRTCDSVGVGRVHLLYNREEVPHVSARVSSSAQKWLELSFHDSLEETYAGLRAQGLRIYATGLGGEAMAPHEVDWTAPSAVVLGNENRGVSDEAVQQADALIYIPMRGMVQSVNVTVAAAMLLYEAQRQRQEAGLYDEPRLPEAVWREILERWLARERRRGRE